MSNNILPNRKKYCTFYIVRHGETELNVKGLLQGIQDSALTPLGEKQAKVLAIELRNVDFDLIFSSDLLRAKRTAEIIALERNLAVKTSELLRERQFGKFEGRPREELAVFDQVFEKLSDKEKYKHS